MTLSYTHVALLCSVYLGVIFAIAYTTERGWLPDKLITHPVTYIFSLGIFASAWSFYGVIDLAQRYGYGALAYYLGTGILFLFSASALKPLIELARRFQITSMADLLVFRYHSHAVGGFVSLVLIFAMVPLLALQMQAVSDTIHLLTIGNQSPPAPADSDFGVRHSFALIYCSAISLFAMIFGSSRDQHKGLITVMAFESLIKLFGLLAMGWFTVTYVFGGFSGLQTWLELNPEQLSTLKTSASSPSAHALVLIFIATAVSMPHIFHLTVVENPAKHTHRTVTWAFPLFLLLMALPVFPILWAGTYLDLESPTEYFPLAIPIGLNNTKFATIAFVGGLSAASGAMIAIALALSTMVLNHLILPFLRFGKQQDVYRQIIWMRRGLIAAVIMVSYIFYVLLNNRFNITELALTAFIATLQLLPSILSVSHWPKGNHKGLIFGLAVGFNIWLFCLLIPMLLGVNTITVPYTGITLSIGFDSWSTITLWSLGLNTFCFIAISYLTKQPDSERYSAEWCSEDELSHPIRMTIDVRSPEEIIERLSSRIGRSTAQLEVQRAMQRLGIRSNETRPYSLRRLRDEVESNLSSLMGISMASEIMDRLVPYKLPSIEGATDINLIESRLGQVRDHLTGLAAELNNLRLYHRRTLEELPLATCSIGADMEVLMWNSAMSQLTGISSDSVIGSRVENVSEPWGRLLTQFANSLKPKFYKRKIKLNNDLHWITLHKSAIPSSEKHKEGGQVLILEDVTDLQRLEDELVHSERLATVGRLAAGVAHEIGNPVTGIACLAQNMKYETEEPEVLETGEQILSLTHRVTRIVQSLVSFSHAGQQSNDQLQRVKIAECAQEAISLLSLQKEKKQVHFINRISEEIQVEADGQRLIQVFINLLSNSRDASAEGTEVVIEGESDSSVAKVTITDHGTGIPQDMLGRIFEPFFTTKDPGEGTGLGLAMVYTIIEDHKGQIEIESPVHKDSQNGTRFIITLPLELASDASKSNTIDIVK